MPDPTKLTPVQTDCLIAMLEGPVMIRERHHQARVVLAPTDRENRTWFSMVTAEVLVRKQLAVRGESWGTLQLTPEGQARAARMFKRARRRGRGKKSP